METLILMKLKNHNLFTDVDPTDLFRTQHITIL